MRLPTSEPASGSDIAIASTFPRTIPVRISCLSSSVANRCTGRAAIIVIGKNPIGIWPRANSSHSRHMSTWPPPLPPYSSGIETPTQPSSAMRS